MCTKYLMRKRGIFYYRRRIPKQLSQHYRTHEVRISLGVRSEDIALKRAASINSLVERDWEKLELYRQETLISNLRTNPSLEMSGSPSVKLTKALKIYLRYKSPSKGEVFIRSATRSITYLTKAIGNKLLNELSRADANAYRDYLLGKGMTETSAKRNISNIKAIINFTCRELDLPLNNSFNALHFNDLTEKKIRPPIPPNQMKKIQQECLVISDELRLVIALISDTGMRLSEALGLQVSDLYLSHETPHVLIKTHPWRSLKTVSSNRLIPLIGASLQAAKLSIKGKSSSDFVFPKYCDGIRTKSNSASAALNKWLKPRVNEGCVIHSFRHSFRDRLRAVECPSDLIDELGGWSKGSVGENYGSGYPDAILRSWMEKICLV